MEEERAPPQDANPSMDDDYKESAGGENGDTAAAESGMMNEESMNNTSTTGDDGQVNNNNNNNGGDGGSGGGGNLYLRPIFLGNLSHSCMAADVENLFRNPPPMSGQVMAEGEVRQEVRVDRVDMKRGYAFVFLKDPKDQEEKERCEKFCEEINGMNVSQVSNALRAEFARGDGRVKKKEDERRKKIVPNETLFVVNFHEETTKREDLQMLFEPYGELVRIDMKRNYAFVQFKTVEEAIRAKEATNGGKLDQSEITVEFVARRMGEGGGRRDRGDRGGGGRRYDDDRGRGGGGYRGGGYRDDRRGDYRDDRRGDYRPRGGYRGDRYDDDRRGGYRRRSRSRSRSPGYRRRSRSRSPGYDRDHRHSRDEYRPSSRGGRDAYEDRERVEPRSSERGYGRSEY